MRMFELRSCWFRMGETIPVPPPSPPYSKNCIYFLAAAFVAGAFSFRVASCKSSTSTCSGGICMYRTTEPRTKHDFNEINWGYCSGLTILTCMSLIFKYWSTECSVPVRTTLFFNSTATSLPTNVLKKDKKIYQNQRGKNKTKIKHSSVSYETNIEILPPQLSSINQHDLPLYEWRCHYLFIYIIHGKIEQHDV